MSWALVKYRWSLTVDPAELAALRSEIDTSCGSLTVTLPAVAAALVAEPPVVPPNPVAVYRFYSATFGGRFYTIDAAERAFINANWSSTWADEGQRYTAFPTPAPGTIPLYRFWSERLKGHFYTADASEKEHVRNTWPETWAYEGIAYYVYPVQPAQTGTVPVARFWSPALQRHFYTASATERDFVMRNWSNTWSYENDNFRVPSTGSPSIPRRHRRHLHPHHLHPHHHRLSRRPIPVTRRTAPTSAPTRRPRPGSTPTTPTTATSRDSTATTTASPANRCPAHQARPRVLDGE